MTPDQFNALMFMLAGMSVEMFVLTLILWSKK